MGNSTVKRPLSPLCLAVLTSNPAFPHGWLKRPRNMTLDVNNALIPCFLVRRAHTDEQAFKQSLTHSFLQYMFPQGVRLASIQHYQTHQMTELLLEFPYAGGCGWGRVGAGGSEVKNRTRMIVYKRKRDSWRNNEWMSEKLQEGKRKNYV